MIFGLCSAFFYHVILIPLFLFPPFKMSERSILSRLATPTTGAPAASAAGSATGSSSSSGGTNVVSGAAAPSAPTAVPAAQGKQRG